MENGKRTNYWKFILKCLLSGTALYIVFRNIDRQQFVHVFFRANPLWLIAGFLLYHFSKILSSFRLNMYFRDSGTVLSEKGNLILYYIGMFYNLFLPGGIGGDGYKVYLLNRDINTPLKTAFRAVLFDRLSGMVALAVLSFLFGWMAFPEIPYRNAALIATVLSWPVWYLVNAWLAKDFIPTFWKTSLFSLGVQGIQVMCAWCILASLGVADYTSAYLTVFLVSSLVSVLPISVGGIGIRELVFIAAAGLCPIDKSDAVAFSFLFFLITAMSSLPGGFLTVPVLRKG